MARPIVGSRVMGLLNAIPCLLSTSMIQRHCNYGLGKSRSGLLTQLQRLRRVKKVRSFPHRNGLLWISEKWIERDRAPQGVIEMVESFREHLPARRRCITQTVRIFPPTGGKQTVHYSIGLHPDGRPAELFIDVSKAGAALRAWCGESGMMLSIALQHGTPLRTILDLFIGTRNDPCGQVESHPRITQCSSIMDLIARDMAITFLDREDLADKADWECVPVPISDRAELPPPIEGQTCVCHQQRTD
jgi:hypothetical protein